MNIIYLNKEENGEYSYIGIIENVLNKKYSEFIFNYLNSLEDFKEGSTSFGDIPRLQKWYQCENKYFSKTWKDQNIPRWTSHEYSNELIDLQNYIQNYINYIDIYKYPGIKKPNINSCLINKYRNGNDSIRPHRDNQSTFGDNPTVIGMSFGDTRDIIFSRIIYNPLKMNSIKKDTNNNKEIKVSLKHNSLFIMGGAIQKYYSHEIPKETNKNIRYSLTFREYLY